MNPFSRRLTLLVLAMCVAGAHAGTWQVVKNPKANQVKFHSEATLESFDGSTGAISGTVTLQGTTVPKPARPISPSTCGR